MGNEQWQARVPDSLSEEIHEYREEKYMSKSEVVRKALRELVADETTKDADPLRDYDDRNAANQSYTIHTAILMVGIALGYTICLLPL